MWQLKHCELIIHFLSLSTFFFEVGMVVGPYLPCTGATSSFVCRGLLLVILESHYVMLGLNEV